jgi:beta-phosphoglucomutase-like phosphatase (HAD superfamily)
MQIAITKFPDDSFDVCISKDDVSRSKPDPEPYLKAAEILKTEIGKTVVLEDSLTGVKSGLASGAQVVGISHSINFEKSLNLRVVSSLKEIDFSDLLKWYPFLDLAR